MTYKINEQVYVENFQTLKQISDFEIINGVEIYFMEDGTCYSKSQILMSLKDKANFIVKNNEEKKLEYLEQLLKDDFEKRVINFLDVVSNYMKANKTMHPKQG